MRAEKVICANRSRRVSYGSALEDGRMNLLRSICCLFGGRCAVEEPKPTKDTMRGEPSVSGGDLGQKEAELEKAGKDQMGRMEGGDATRHRK
jgi:hypothetical protein